MTGTEAVNPIKFGSPAVDGATGNDGSPRAPRPRRSRNTVAGSGRSSDAGVASAILTSRTSPDITNGAEPGPSGNRHLHATNSRYAAKEGLACLAPAI